MLFFIVAVNIQSQTFPAPIYSRPGISPAVLLDPEDDQLNPNLIHVVILGDGYQVINSSGLINDIFYKFDNKGPSDVGPSGIINPIYSLPPYGGPVYGTGDAEDFIDELIGDLTRTNFPGITPYKEYRDYFRFYRVLYNSPNGNGIGHPYALNSALAISCDPLPPVGSSTETFWGSSFDFCETHRAISCNYDKVDDFLDIYFPGLREQEKVFVIVLTNYGGDAGGASRRSVM